MRRPVLRRPSRGGLALLGAWALAALAAGLYAAASIERHRRFGSNAFDLGLNDQAVWAFSRFDPLLDNTILETPNMLNNHFQPVLAAFAPLYWVWDDVRMLLIAQAALLTSASIPLFLWARRELGTPAAFAFQAAFLAFWALLAGNLYDFHETAVAVPAIAVSLYGLVTRRFGLLLAGAAVALLSKEDLALTVAALFAYAAAVGLRRRASIALALASLAWLVVAVEVLIPWYSGGSYAHWLYPALGSGPGAALAFVAGHPLETLRLFFSPAEKRTALANLLAPWLLLPLVSPLALLALPNLAARFLSDKEAYWSQGFHYSAMIAPVLAFAAVDATRRLRGMVPLRQAAPIAGVVVLAAGLFFTFGRLRPLDEVRRLPSDAYAAGVRGCLGTIPERSSVAATSALVPHLAHRPRVYLLDLGPLPAADFYAIDAYTWTFPLDARGLRRVADRLLDSGYGVRCSRGGTAVFARGADGRLSPELERTLGRA